MPDTIGQKSLFSKPELWCQEHGIQYRQGSYPGEIIVQCLSCKRGRMFLYQSWALCLACGHVSESLQDLERLLPESRAPRQDAQPEELPCAPQELLESGEDPGNGGQS